MPGLVPGIHVFFEKRAKSWMAGTGPAMTANFYSFASEISGEVGFFMPTT